MKMLVYFLNQTVVLSEDEELIDKLLLSYGDYVTNPKIHTEKFPSSFSHFIGLDLTTKKESLHADAIRRIHIK